MNIVTAKNLYMKIPAARLPRPPPGLPPDGVADEPHHLLPQQHRQPLLRHRPVRQLWLWCHWWWWGRRICWRILRFHPFFLISIRNSTEIQSHYHWEIQSLRSERVLRKATGKAGSSGGEQVMNYNLDLSDECSLIYWGQRIHWW